MAEQPAHAQPPTQAARRARIHTNDEVRQLKPNEFRILI